MDSISFGVLTRAHKTDLIFVTFDETEKCIFEITERTTKSGRGGSTELTLFPLSEYYREPVEFKIQLNQIPECWNSVRLILGAQTRNMTEHEIIINIFLRANVGNSIVALLNSGEAVEYIITARTQLLSGKFVLEANGSDDSKRMLVPETLPYQFQMARFLSKGTETGKRCRTI
jgi:hypothetical protein